MTRCAPVVSTALLARLLLVLVSASFTPLAAQELEFRRGDFNSSGVVDISDSIATLEYLFLGASSTSCLDAADSDNSGEVDLTDPIYTLEYLFLGKDTPPAPGADFCGPDPDDDGLGCAAYPMCAPITDGGDLDDDGLLAVDEQRGWRVFVDEQGLGEFFAREVTSDPSLADTDGDGLSDLEEFHLLTDPRRRDTDGDGLDDFQELERWNTNPSSVDSDGDARGPEGALFPSSRFFDGLELRTIGTSPSLADTDGDGKTDFEEFDDPVRSPLVAELPEVEVEFEGEVDVRLNVIYEDSGTEGVDYGGSFSQSQTNTQSRTDTASDRWTAGASVTVGAEYEFGLLGGATVSAEATAYAEYGQERSTSFTAESSRTSQSEYSRYLSESRSRSETAASGSISVGVRIANPGVFTYELKNLSLAVLQWTPAPAGSSETGTFRTVGTLVADLTTGDVGKTLAPGDRSELLQLSARDVDPGLIKSFLENPTTLHYDTTGFELLSGEKINFKFLTEQTFTRTALVVIDYGNGEVERYRVATNVDRGPGGSFPGITMGEVLERVLEIPFETLERADRPGVTALKRVRDVDTLPVVSGPLPVGAWTVFTTAADQAEDDVSFEDQVLRHGDVVRLVYTRDADQDGLFAREERLFGTEDLAVDTDGDGLSDVEEIRGGWEVRRGETVRRVRSSPIESDFDGDGLEDPAELEQGTDPYLADTDGDGESDGREIELGTSPLLPDDFIGLRREAVSEIRGHLRASLAEAKNQLLPALEVRVQYARQNYERMSALHRVGAVSQSELLESERDLESARTEYESVSTEFATVEDLLNQDVVYLEETLETLDEALAYFPGWFELMESRGLNASAASQSYTLATWRYEELRESL